MWRLSGCVFLVTLVLLNSSNCSQKDSGAASRRHALLIGCTKYRHLEMRLSLDGPANDVGLMRQMLRERFGFTKDDIVELTERSEPHLQPDRENIVREMNKLVGRVKSGDDVLVFLAGHGSQQPDDKGDADDNEPDGFDEVFLPADVTNWQAKQHVTRGISDDTIRSWLTGMRHKGAFVFFVADTCHAGTISRGPEAGDEESSVKVRHIPPEVLTSPEDLKRVTSATADRVDGKFLDGSPTGSTIGGLAAFTAVPANSLEQEHTMPPNTRFGDPRYGRFTYALHHVLMQSKSPLTYRELAQQVAWYYREQRWFPMGGVEGVGLDREVLGKREWKDRSTLVLSRAEDETLYVNQGLVRGITEKTILRVFPPVGSVTADKLLGYLTVVSSDPMTAIVKPLEFEGFPAQDPKLLPTPARCDVERIDYGQLQQTVRVRSFSKQELSELASLGKKLKSADAEDVERFSRLLRDIVQQPASLITFAREDTAADLYLLVAKEGAYLRCRSVNASADEKNPTPQYLGPYQFDVTSSVQLGEDLTKVACATNLRGLVTGSASQAIESDEVSLETQYSRAASKLGPFTQVTDLATTSFTHGDQLRITMTNVGRVPIDVTVLYIDAQFQIQSHFPTARQALAQFDNTIAPRKSANVTIGLNDSTIGLEDVVILAVASDPMGPPVNFTDLSQSGLSRGQTNSKPLDALLKSAFHGGARGASSSNAARMYQLKHLPILVVKRSSAKP